MLPNFDYGRQIMHTDVKKKGLPQMSANRPSIWFTRIDFSAQIVKSPEILSHLLLMVAIFPFPCAIRFPKSNRQTPTSPISSAFSGRYSAFSHFASFSCCVFPLCLSVVSPRGGNCNCSPSTPFWAVKLWGRAVPSASPERHNEETQRVPLHFPDQSVKSPGNPISSAFSRRYLSLAAPVCH